jgi:hypothetical protein
MHWVGYDQVYKPGSQTQDINANPLSEKEELSVALRLLSINFEAKLETLDRLRPWIAIDVGRQEKGRRAWWGPSYGVRYFTLFEK